jgi:DNA polymerase-3 subunit beta
MKITLSHEKLSKLLMYTSRAVSTKPNIPILSNVKMEVSKSNLNLSATNLDMGINLWIPGVVESEGNLTVSAKFIADFVNASGGEKVELELKDNVLLVETDKSKANFNIIPADEFPIMPKLPENHWFRIDKNEFIKTLEKVLFACSTELTPGKVHMSGALIEVEGEEVSFVGLDGFRLSKRSVKPIELNALENLPQIIVPSKYLNELIKISSDATDVEEVVVYLSDNRSQIIFKLEEIEFSIRLLEGPYSDYKKIMPDSATFTFEFKRSDLENAIKVVSTFARSNLNYKALVDFDIENKHFKMRSSVTDVGDNETEVDMITAEADTDLNAAYNLKYLQDIVAHTKGDTLKVESKGALTATVFRDLSDEKFVHLLMPLRRDA